MNYPINKGNTSSANRFSGIFSKIWKFPNLIMSHFFFDSKLIYIPVKSLSSKNFIQIGAIIIYVLLFQNSISQNWSGNQMNQGGNSWAININSGLTSYYGDLSIYDSNFGQKLLYESGPALGFIFTKKYRNTFGLSAQVLMGKLTSANGDVSMSSDILEYNLHLRINLISLFAPKDFDKLELSGYAGIGNFLFKTTTYMFTEGNQQQMINSTRVPEFIYFSEED